MIIKNFPVVILKEMLKYKNTKFCHEFKALSRKHGVVQILPERLASGVK